MLYAFCWKTNGQTNGWKKYQIIYTRKENLMRHDVGHVEYYQIIRADGKVYHTQIRLPAEDML